MSLIRVTITGADNSTDIQELVGLSAEFPFVEWGILVSERKEGSYRFPSRGWIDEFSAAAPGLQVCTHVCGKWVRSMLTGLLDWGVLPKSIGVSQRIQINTHAEPHTSTTGLIKTLRELDGKEFIFQWDGVNDHLSHAVNAYGIRTAALFDTSGGAGILPDGWPEPTKLFWCGYAGGLGPNNVAEQIDRIEQVCERPFWIDMERRVRSEDDSRLDMAAVRKVLELAAERVSVPL